MRIIKHCRKQRSALLHTATVMGYDWGKINGVRASKRSSQKERVSYNLLDNIDQFS